jgi:DNA repair exonuclease SbcCD ATPase subunit
MIVKYLELHNYRQHDHLREVFEGNLIGVLGPNGSGKSHFMDAMEFGFAGKVPRQDKSDMLSWGAEEGYVKVGFEHNGVDGEIYREIHSTKASFTYGELKVSGITKVNNAIAEATGLDADICKQAVFVHQKEVDAVLFTEPSVRQMAWQRLCGLGEAATTHKRLGEFINCLPEVTDYTEQIGDAMQRIAEAKDELAEAQENLNITDMGDLRPEEIEAAIRQIGELKNAIEAGTTESAILGEDQKKLHAAHNNLQDVEGKLGGYLDDPADLLKSATDRMNEAVRSLTAIRKKQQYEAEKASVEQQLQQLLSPHTEAEIAEASARLLDIQNTLAAAQNTLNMANRLLEAVQGTDAGERKCPLCRQEVTGDISALAATNQAAAQQTVNVARSEAQAAEAEVKTMKDAVKSYEYSKATLDQKMTSVLAHIGEVQSGITVQTSDDEVKALQQKVDELQVTVKFKQDLEMRKSGFENQIQSLDAAVKQRGARVEELLNKAQLLMRGVGISDARKIEDRQTALEADAAKCREVSQEVARLTGQIAEMEKALANLNKTVEELQEREQKQSALKSVLDTLAAVRAWFHYQNGPQAVINSLLERITSGVNDFLDKFGAGFYAIPDFGTTSFKYWYTDGRMPPEDGYPPVSEMSGGEAVVLAVSFRFATYCLFASRIGLLTLDEPTVYLDDNNISRFCNLLQRVKELATDMNLQIFISTHEQAVMPFMDSTIKFGTYNTPEEEEDEREEDAA